MSEPKPNQDADLRQFNTMIVRLEGGALNEEMTEAVKRAIKEISDACLDRGGTHKASVTLRLDFVMSQKDKIVEITADVQEKHPKAPRGRAGVFFCNSEGELMRNSPHQMTIEDELQKRRDAERIDAYGVVHSSASGE